MLQPDAQAMRPSHTHVHHVRVWDYEHVRPDMLVLDHVPCLLSALSNTGWCGGREQTD
jgi:hypothetical protein